MNESFKLREPPAGLTATEYAAFRAGAIGMILELQRAGDADVPPDVSAALEGEYKSRVRDLEVAALERQRGLVSDEEAIERDVREALNLGGCCCGGSGCGCEDWDGCGESGGCC